MYVRYSTFATMKHATASPFWIMWFALGTYAGEKLQCNAELSKKMVFELKELESEIYSKALG